MRSIKVLYFPSKTAQRKLDTLINRGFSFSDREAKEVSKILAEVRRDGDQAVIRYVNLYDAPDLPVTSLQVTEAEIENACRCVEKEFMNSLNTAARKIEEFHKHQVEKSWITTHPDGTILGQLVNPVDAAGIYIPGGSGGSTPLVSTVLMCCIPARIAGVRRICIVTPPTAEGTVSPYILAAAHSLGVTDIFKAGSAWGIAALAFGTETIPRVDIIVGPGNVYVTIAKKMVSGMVGIDMIAGPSEILVIADQHANPEFISADLLSQAEHDTLASVILLTTSRKLARSVADNITVQLKSLPRKGVAEVALKKYGALIVVPDLPTAFSLANRIAPEHLELHIEDPFRWLGQVHNAGAIFLGPHTPEPVGDYIAGPNHVLPTTGAARYASALSVGHFLKKTSVVYYSEEGFGRDAGDIVRLAQIEGLSAHAHAIKVRMDTSK